MEATQRATPTPTEELKGRVFFPSPVPRLLALYLAREGWVCFHVHFLLSMARPYKLWRHFQWVTMPTACPNTSPVEAGGMNPHPFPFTSKAATTEHSTGGTEEVLEAHPVECAPRAVCGSEVARSVGKQAGGVPSFPPPTLAEWPRGPGPKPGSSTPVCPVLIWELGPSALVPIPNLYLSSFRGF